MVTTYTYDKDNNDLNLLSREIRESAITNVETEFEGIEDTFQVSPSENLIISFTNALSASDELILDGIVVAHDPLLVGPFDTRAVVSRYLANRDPNGDDDSSKGVRKGATWINELLGAVFSCVDNSEGSAVWAQTSEGLLGAVSNTIIFEHWVSGNADPDEMGSYGWRQFSTGVGSDVSLSGEADHPGVLLLNAGTGSTGVASIHAGDGSTASFIIGGTNDIRFDFLIKISGSILATDLELMSVGLGLGWGMSGELTDGLYIRYNPTVSTFFQLVANDSGGITTSSGTTIVVIDTWYKVSVVISDPGGSPSAQLKIDDVDEGSPVTSNIPTSLLGLGMKIDSVGGASSPVLNVDYSILKQAI